MDIICLQNPITLSNAKKIKSITEITEKSRLFYELGHYKILRKYTDKDGMLCKDTEWIREGTYKEINDVKEYIKSDNRLLDEEFIEHHNFVIIN